MEVIQKKNRTKRLFILWIILTASSLDFAIVILGEGCAETENSVVIAILLLLGLAIWCLRLVGIGRFVSIIAAEVGFGS